MADCWELTYNGPSGRFADPTTGLVWNAGETQTVDDSTKERLSARRSDRFSAVPCVSIEEPFTEPEPLISEEQPIPQEPPAPEAEISQEEAPE